MTELEKKLTIVDIRTVSQPLVAGGLSGTGMGKMHPWVAQEANGAFFYDDAREKWQPGE